MATAGTSLDERLLVEQLRRGDEAAFEALLDCFTGPLTRLARVYVRDRAVADEVVQETWLGVLRGIDRFEGRSSFKTWLFRILTNTAKTRGEREGRSVPFSTLAEAGDDDEPAVEPERFLGPESRWPGHWASFPRSFSELPDQRLLAQEARALVLSAIEALPRSQRAVITLRDLDGWSSEEVRNVLELSETNQRVLLHRARSKVRRALEHYFEEEGRSDQ